MNKLTTSALAAIILAAGMVSAEEADTAEGSTLRVRAGAAYRGGMKVRAKGGGSYAAGIKKSSTKTSGNDAANGADFESSSLTFGYTGGDRTFGSGTTALGSGTIHADGTYSGGDYSAASDDVYFSDNRETTETLGGRQTTTSAAKGAGELAWGDDDMDGWGATVDFEYPLLEFEAGLSIGAILGFRGYWNVDGAVSGSGAGVEYRTKTSTSATSTRTTSSFYDVTAPLNLDGTLDLANAEVFQGEVVKYAPGAAASSSSSRSFAASRSTIEAEADLFQTAIGAAVQLDCGRLALSLRPSLLLNVIDAEAKRTEVLSSASGKVVQAWTDEADESHFALGFGLDISADFALCESMGVWVSGGYEWIDKVGFDVGPQRVELDPSAWTVSVGIRYTF